MNILFLTPRIPFPPYRGDKLKIFNLIKELSRANRVVLVSFVEESVRPEEIDALKAYCAEVITVKLPRWRSLWNCLMNVFSDVPYQVAYYRSSKMTRLLGQKVDWKSFDVVHVHLIRMAQYALERRSGAVRVLDLTDAGSLYLERFSNVTPNAALRIMLHAELSRLKRYEQVISRFDTAFVCSAIDRDILTQRVSNSHVDLLYNGVDLDYFVENTERTVLPHHLIYTGNMTYFPNVDGARYFVHEILPLIRARVPDVRLSIVGKDPPAAVRRLKRDGVTVTGFVPDIRQYYLESEIAVAPIRFGAGTLNKILEPMALGVPVVASSIGVEGLPLEHDRHLLIADTPETFAACVVRLLSDHAVAVRIAANAKDHVRTHYGWKSVAATLQSSYAAGCTAQHGA